MDDFTHDAIAARHKKITDEAAQLYRCDSRFRMRVDRTTADVIKEMRGICALIPGPDFAKLHYDVGQNIAFAIAEIMSESGEIAILKAQNANLRKILEMTPMPITFVSSLDLATTPANLPQSDEASK